MEQPPLTSLNARRPVVTWLLVGACAAVFLLMTAGGASMWDPPVEQVLAWGGSFGPAALGRDWWRLLTETFVHVGLVHLGLNMWCLLTLGPVAERVFGRGMFLVLYLVAGIAGSITSVLVHPLIVTAGASGAIFGVAGALLVTGMWRDRSMSVAALSDRVLSIATFILYNLVYGLQESGIDNAAHLGGLLAGAALGMALPLATPRSPAPGVRAWLVGTAACVALAAGFGAVRRQQAPVAAFGAALTDLDAGRTSRAIGRLRAIVARRPQFAEAQYALGVTYVKRGMPDSAIPALRAAAGVSPHNVDYENELGVALLRHGEEDSAVAVFERAASLAPESAPIRGNLGLAYLSAMRPDDAAAAFRKAIELAPATQKYRLLLGRAYLASQAFDKAIATFDSVLVADPRNAFAILGRATAYDLLGRQEAARRDLEALVRLGAENAADSEMVRAAQRRLTELSAPARERRQLRVYQSTADLDRRPRLLGCPAPAYPDSLRRQRVEGVVVFRLIVDTLGHVEPASIVVYSESHPGLEDAGRAAVLECAYQAGRLHGHAVRVQVQQGVLFKLANARP